MKKTIFLAILMASLTANSQLYFGGSFGLNTTALRPAGSANLGLNVHDWILQTGFNTTFGAKEPALYRITGGRSFEIGELSYLAITGGIGYFDTHYDNSKGYRVSGNSTWVASVEYAKDFMGRGQYYFEVTQAKKSNFVMAGLKFFFVNHKDGCPASW